MKLKVPNRESEPMIFKSGDKIYFGYHVGKAEGKEIYELVNGGYLAYEHGKIEVGDSIDKSGALIKKKKEKEAKEVGKADKAP